MPRAPRTPQEVEAVKQEILDTALDLIRAEGFENLSMRRIASRLGITATTIYNYYANKDELNLMIRIRGFQILYSRLEEPSLGGGSVEERLGNMIRAYAEFGVSHPGYYDIMFNLNTPKYADYAGTQMEPTALREKENALRCFEIFYRMVKEYARREELALDEEDIRYLLIRMWSDLHGIVSLYNSRVLYEVDEQTRSVLNRRVEDLIGTVMEIRDRLTNNIKSSHREAP